MNLMSKDIGIGIGIGALIGAVAGILATASFYKKTYSEAADRRIESIVKYYESAKNPVNNPEPEEEPIPSMPVAATDFSIVIDAEEYDDDSSFSKREYSYYTDGVITNDYDIPLTDEDFDECFGFAMRDIIDNISDSPVYIRNYRDCIDYMISPIFAAFDKE